MPPIARAATATMVSSDGDVTRKKRMLCLHGKGGNAASFARGLAPLVDATSNSWDWHFADGTQPEPNPGGRGWWTLQPGQRTYNAASLPGLDISMKRVIEAGPWDGLFGFSQGAMLAALVIAEDGGKQKQERAIKELAIIVGAAWPTCAAAKLETLQPSDVVRSLHVVGERDVINPPAQARRVAEAFGANAQVFEHERGHIVPMTDDAVATYVKFIEHL